MKATGIVRKIDELGRITLPRELRRTLDLQEKDPVEIYTDGKDIILRKYAPGCAFCGSMNDIRYIHSTPVCGSCAYNMQMLYRTAEGSDDE